MPNNSSITCENLEVAPNGHPNAQKRPLRGKGIKYILEVSGTLFNFAIKRRHLPPYTENPFTAIAIDRMPVEGSRPFVDLTVDQERTLLEACDDWQFPILLTLILTGLRPGELTHLLLLDDLDLRDRWLYVRNKPELGWQVKTWTERSIPLMPELVAVFRVMLGKRDGGPLFLRRRFADGLHPCIVHPSRECAQLELHQGIDLELTSLKDG